MPSQLQGRNVEGAQGLQKYCSTHPLFTGECLTPLTNICSATSASVYPHWDLEHIHPHRRHYWHCSNPCCSPEPGNLEHRMQSEPVLTCLYCPAPRTKPISNKPVSDQQEHHQFHKSTCSSVLPPRPTPPQDWWSTRPSHAPASIHPEPHRQLFCFWASGLSSFCIWELVYFFSPNFMWKGTKVIRGFTRSLFLSLLPPTIINQLYSVSTQDR